MSEAVGLNSLMLMSEKEPEVFAKLLSLRGVMLGLGLTFPPLPALWPSRSGKEPDMIGASLLRLRSVLLLVRERPSGGFELEALPTACKALNWKPDISAGSSV